MSVHPEALKIAALATGLRADQVERALAAYRDAVAQVEAEPEWQAQTHISGSGMGLHLYTAEGTAVHLNIEAWEERGEWKQARIFVLNGQPFEHYAEARAVELASAARPKPYEVPT